MRAVVEVLRVGWFFWVLRVGLITFSVKLLENRHKFKKYVSGNATDTVSMVNDNVSL